jgi:tRNA(Arg) A34 adenosine deaminase TadA
MIKTKDVKFISDALEYARKNRNSKGYTIVAYLVQGKRIVSVGVNDYKKTHAKTPQIHNYVIPGHSEIKCLAKYLVKGRRISSDMTLYVVGLTQAKIPNPVISSKPCESCENFIRSVGIPRVVYFENVEKFTIKEWRRVV